jgi:two-component system OmpR family response regulator
VLYFRKPEPWDLPLTVHGDAIGDRDQHISSHGTNRRYPQETTAGTAMHRHLSDISHVILLTGDSRFTDRGRTTCSPFPPALGISPDTNPVDGNMKILIIEDNQEMAAHLRAGLSRFAEDIDCIGDGRHGLSMAISQPWDLLILDRMLPQLDGLSVLRELRSCGGEMPVLMVSALGEVDSRVEGLEAGADDYLAKPFAMSELNARVAALARRPRLAEPPTRVSVAGLTVDRISREVCRDGRVLELQPREFRLLDYLISHAGRVVTRSMLLEHVWEFHFEPQTSVVETHISRLRAKIDRGFENELLHTVRNVGYILRAAD